MAELETKTTEEVLQIGGWWWFQGKINHPQLTVAPIKGEYVIYVPLPEHNTGDPLIPFWGEWLRPSAFAGRWVGPIECPFDESIEHPMAAQW